MGQGVAQQRRVVVRRVQHPVALARHAEQAHPALRLDRVGLLRQRLRALAAQLDLDTVGPAAEREARRDLRIVADRLRGAEIEAGDVGGGAARRGRAQRDDEDGCGEKGRGHGRGYRPAP